MSAPIRIHYATTEEEKRAIYRLRYDIYVEEMNRRQSYADHSQKEIHEPFDDLGHLFYAESEGQVIGTVRINFRKESELECEDLYDLEAFRPFYPNQVSMSTKLMVRKEYRSSPTAGMLCMRIYEHAREHGILLDFIDTNPHLVRLYSQVGYRMYKKNIDHPDYGNVIPMVFLLDDVNYLRDIHSPFLRLAKRFQNEEETSKLFQQKFSQYANIRPLFSLDANQLWASLSHDFALAPEDVLGFLKGFSQEEATKLLGMVDLLEYEPGALVFRQNQESQGLFCILEGSAEVQVNRDGKVVTIAILQRGEIFGELGFLTKTTRTASIVMREKSKLLVLTPSEFQKLEIQQPSMALKLLTNLFGILAQRFNDMSKLMLTYRGMVEESA